MLIIKTPYNLGFGMARQYGLDRATADYVTFLDDDDEFLPDGLLRLATVSETTECDCITSSFLSEDEAGEMTTIQSLSNVAWLHGKLFKLSYLRENLIQFNPYLKTNEDIYFCAVAWWSSMNRVDIFESTYIWHYNPKSASHTLTKKECYEKTNADYTTGLIMALDKIYSIVGEVPVGILIGSMVSLFQSFLVERKFPTNDKSYIWSLNSLSIKPYIQAAIDRKDIIYKYSPEVINPFDNIEIKEKDLFYKWISAIKKGEDIWQL